ncbi:PREDICTED: uncharacterized protein LOC109326524 isoform X2 [Lupinus angustifolius]|uniref:uncharacterized protein LOC109326524 isoform X2 n=1 Tax=Lupinus angustifolius TaxID=3871 RepID=UPI00092E3809|nr:PREDICTED: uncharacterized protein LOC109326524 isoform X2 [Lupinus angustifolius]
MKRAISLHHHSIVLQRQQPHLQDKDRGYTAEEEENHSVTEYPPYKHFLENRRPVETSFGHDIIKDNVFDTVKYPAEENCAENDDDSVIADSQYKFFLEHLRPDGKSYALDIIEDDVYVKYEPSSPELEALTECAVEIETHVSNVAIVDTEMPAPAAKYKGKRRGRKPKGFQELHAAKDPNGNRNPVTSEEHKHEHARKRSSKRNKKNVLPSTEAQAIDHRIKDESEDDAPSIRRPVQNPVLNVEIFCDEDDDGENVRKRTEYRQKLMEELKKPYFQEEYEKLLEEITVRKPAQGQKVLRRRTKIYKEGFAAKSYFDCHIDLKRKIYTASDDKPKVLNLLRGFFFWLVNVSHEGKFRPWRVQSYLDELLQH